MCKLVPSDKVACPRVDAKRGAATLPLEVFSTAGRTPLKVTATNDSGQKLSGPLGQGWGHSYDMQATRVIDPDTGRYQTIVRAPDGKRIRFNESAAGSLIGPSDWHGVAAKSGDSLVLAAADKTIYSFDSHGFIQQIQYDHGRSISMAYDDDHHRLKTVQTDAEIAAEYVYGADFKLNQVVASTGQVAKFTVSGGVLSQVLDPSGGRTAIGYTQSKRISSLTDGENRKMMDLSYDPQGRVTQVKAGGGTATIKYDAPGQFASVTYADSSSVTLTYDANAQPSSSIDANGAQTRFSVDSSQQVTAVVDPLLRQTKYSYSPDGNVTSVVSPDGTTRTITFVPIAGAERQTEVRQPSGATSRIDYDLATGLPTKTTDASGKVVNYSYDAKGQVTQTIRGSGLTSAITYAPHGGISSVSVTNPSAGGASPKVATTQYSYDFALRPKTIQDPLGNTTETTYDGRGDPLTVKAADGGVTTYTRDAVGNVIAVTNGRGFTSTTKYDALRRVVTTTNAKNQPTTFSYDLQGRLTTTTNFRSETSTNFYDRAGRVIQRKDAAGNSTFMTYDPAGQLLATRDGRGFTTGYVYDANGRLINQLNPDSTSTTTTYSVDGYVTSTTDELGRTTSYELDEAGRVKVVHLPDGVSTTSTTYDADGRPLDQTDPLGRITRTKYDELGRPFQTIMALGLPDEVTYTTEYDLAGRVSAIVTAKGARWSYTYDPMGRKKTETDPLNNTRSWEYDFSGNVTKITEPNTPAPLITTLTYDGLNRPLAISRPDESVNVLYDDAANKTFTTITRGAVTLPVNRFYDAIGRMTVEAVGSGAAARGMVYTFDANSNVLTAQATNYSPLRYTYDSRNRCISIVDPNQSTARTVTFGYDKAGQMTSLTYPSKIKKLITYGSRGETTSIQYRTALDNPIRTLTFVYDRALRLKTKSDAAGASSPAVTAYEYDNLDRLTKVTYPDGGIERFGYDPAGNIITYSSPSVSQIRTHDAADQLLTITGTNTSTFTYNVRGQMTRRQQSGAPTRDFAFDSAGRLINVVDGTTSLIRAAYRDNHELHTTTIGTDTQMLLWSMGNVLIQYANGGDGVGSNQLLSGPGQDTPIERTPFIFGTAHETYLTDHLQTAIAAYDDAGSVIRSTEYNAYGTVRAGVDPGLTGFHGGRKLGSTGLYYLRHRIYDPALGRFLSRDPVGFSGGDYNLYRYVSSRPTMFRDPLGLFIQTDGLAGAALSQVERDPVYGPKVADIRQNPTLVWKIKVLNAAGPIVGDRDHGFAHTDTGWIPKEMIRACSDRIAENQVREDQDLDPLPPIAPAPIETVIYLAEKTKQYHTGGRLIDIDDRDWIASRIVHELWHVETHEDKIGIINDQGRSVPTDLGYNYELDFTSRYFRSRPTVPLR